MFIDLGNRVALTDDQFKEEMAKRREYLKLTKPDVVIGCPLCNVSAPAAAPSTNQQQQNQ
jgi:heme O synthase-like polyprenyltransferase